ncbi:hypothetical protein [Ascidiimonas sp. W6]|uniref:hypothetical protein n=1 Tax=Ascidiimonas meishanensis TaxID=3128903 RepID=UPI0030EBDDFC
MEEKEFIVNVGPGATFTPSGDFYTRPEDVDAMFQRFQENNSKNITLYFHGGLVKEKSGRETAARVQPYISEASQEPIFVVWETGLFETFSNNIKQVTDTKLYQKVLKMVIRKVSEKLGFDLEEGRSAGVMKSEDEVEAELAKPIPYQHYSRDEFTTSGRGAEAIAELPDDEQMMEQMLNAEFRRMVQTDAEIPELIEESDVRMDEMAGRGIVNTAMLVKNLAAIAFRVIKRFIKKRDHHFYPTIVEETLRQIYIADIGAWVWTKMKKKSADMWKDNDDKVGLGQHAGRYLLDKLAVFVANHQDVQVNLVGHSAGSIVICNLLKKASAHYPALKFNKIVFMAPACRVDLFHKEVVKNTNRFNSFRMYTMTDHYETQDMMIPYFYTHSLLYLVSGILEDEGDNYDIPILGMERFIDGRVPYQDMEIIRETNTFLYENSKSSLVFSVTETSAVEGEKSTSEAHGDFDDDTPTLKSLTHFLRSN